MPAEFNTLVSLSLTGFKVVQYFVFKVNVTIFYFPISNFLFFNVKNLTNSKILSMRKNNNFPTLNPDQYNDY